jgi:5-dehydro-2-deoxygluconokinase
VERGYDVLAMGRSSIDLYANEIGAPFTEVKSFSAYVGGSPTNISVAARRLGLRAALLTAVGEDLVGDFVLDFLKREGVEAKFSPRKAGRRTSAFMLAVQPPDKFSIVPYRDNCADLELTMEDVRDELWPDLRDYAAQIHALLPLVNVIIGTIEELEATLGIRPARRAGKRAVIKPSDPLYYALRGGIEKMLGAGPEALIVKRGARSTLVFGHDGDVVEAETFPVKVLNVLGAGDAFAGGFLYGYLSGWPLKRAALMGNACGAIVVTRHGCANFMPTKQEVQAFKEERGGF